MNRRLFLLMPISALAYPLMLQAQRTGKPVRIGVLSSTSPEARSAVWDAFKDGMTKHGWIEGREVTYLYRYTRGDFTKFAPLAIELVAEMPDLIFAGTTPAAIAAKRATREIPIVFALASEPVESGLIASLARPGSNATGLTSSTVETRTKLLELLREIVPQLHRISVFVSRSELGKHDLRSVELAARARGIGVESVIVGNQDELEKGFQSLSGKRPDGVVFLAIGVDMYRNVPERMMELRMPTIYPNAEAVVAGGLISYGVEVADNYRRAAEYVDRILKGAKPADLPVQQPRMFDLAVNLKVARAQGIKIPQSILLRATRVIE